MGLGTNYAHQDCSLARALEVVGERWSMLIIRDAFYGVYRFNDFLTHLEIPRAVLTSRLRSLVAAGVLAQEPYPSSPVRHGYVLTEAGRQLWQPVYGLAHWGEQHATEGSPRTLFHHAVCDTRLDSNGACPECGGLVPPEDIVMRPGPGAQDSLRQDPVSRALAGPHRLLTRVRPEAA